jgi:hypothetical protein
MAMQEMAVLLHRRRSISQRQVQVELEMDISLGILDLTWDATATSSTLPLDFT